MMQKEVKDKLDEIVRLLESIRSQLQYHREGQLFWCQPKCNCGDYQHGTLTGGWYCPVHGQRY